MACHGDKPMPKRWMQSWAIANPEWQYIPWDNERSKTLDLGNNKKREMHHRSLGRDGLRRAGLGNYPNGQGENDDKGKWHKRRRKSNS